MCDYCRYAKMFKALSDGTRLKICTMIADNEICGCRLLDKLHITQPTLSYHMKLLCESGVAKSRKEGTLMMYSIDDKSLDDIDNMVKFLRKK